MCSSQSSPPLSANMVLTFMAPPTLLSANSPTPKPKSSPHFTSTSESTEALMSQICPLSLTTATFTSQLDVALHEHSSLKGPARTRVVLQTEALCAVLKVFQNHCLCRRVLRSAADRGIWGRKYWLTHGASRSRLCWCRGGTRRSWGCHRQACSMHIVELSHSLHQALRLAPHQLFRVFRQPGSHSSNKRTRDLPSCSTLSPAKRRTFKSGFVASSMEEGRCFAPASAQLSQNSLEQKACG